MKKNSLKTAPTIDETRETGKHKLSSEEQMEFVKRIAWFWRPAEIVKFMEEQYGKKLSKLLIPAYRNSENWKPLIEQFREEYLANLSAVPLANKRKRLDELQAIYEQAIDSGDVKEARNIIGDFRDEMEKKVGDVSFHFTQVNNNEYQKMTDEDIQKERIEALKQLENVRRMKKIKETGRAENPIEIQAEEIKENE